jgi:hypothetical protein
MNTTWQIYQLQWQTFRILHSSSKIKNASLRNLSRPSASVVNISVTQVGLVAYHSHPDISEHTCRTLQVVEKLRHGSMIFWILHLTFDTH